MRNALMSSLIIVVLVAMLFPILIGGINGYERNRQEYIAQMRADHRRRIEESARRRAELKRLKAGQEVGAPHQTNP